MRGTISAKPLKPLDQVTLGDLATKDDLKNLVTKDHFDRELADTKEELRREFKQEIGSATNMLLGEIGKANARLEELAGVQARVEELAGVKARVEEMSGLLARLVARSEGVSL